MSSVPFKFAQRECQTWPQSLQVKSQDFPPEVLQQGHLDLMTLGFDFDVLVLSSLAFPSDSDKDVARGELRPVLRSDDCRMLLLLGVLSKVEFTTKLCFSLSLLDDLVLFSTCTLGLIKEMGVLGELLASCFFPLILLKIDGKGT